MKPLTLGDANVNSVEVIQVIRIEFNRGAGVPGDPVRRIVQYWLMDGHMLVEIDTWKESQPKEDKPHDSTQSE